MQRVMPNGSCWRLFGDTPRGFNPATTVKPAPLYLLRAGTRSAALEAARSIIFGDGFALNNDLVVQRAQRRPEKNAQQASGCQEYCCAQDPCQVNQHVAAPERR
jgi:hypothetical protein